jgi:hypothetical protein
LDIKNLILIKLHDGELCLGIPQTQQLNITFSLNLITMKVGKRKQQGQKGTMKTKEVCPNCEKEYLENLYVKKEGKLKVFGKYCPAENCNFIRRE